MFLCYNTFYGIWFASKYFLKLTPAFLKDKKRRSKPAFPFPVIIDVFAHNLSVNCPQLPLNFSVFAVVAYYEIDIPDEVFFAE